MNGRLKMLAGRVGVLWMLFAVAWLTIDAQEVAITQRQYDSQSHAVVVTLKNSSSKVVTAFALQLRVDGKIKGGMTTDMLPLVISNRIDDPNGDPWAGALSPNGTYVEKVPVGPSTGDAAHPSLYDISLSGILFSDGSMSENSKLALKSVLDERDATTRTLAQVLQIIKNRATTDDIDTRLTLLSSDLKSAKATSAPLAQRPNANTMKQNGLSPHVFDFVGQEIATMSHHVNGEQRFEAYTTQLQKRYDLMSQYSVQH